MNTSNITNYKPKEFAELLNVSVKTLQRWDWEQEPAPRRGHGRKYEKRIERDEEIAEGVQDGDSSDDRAGR